MELILHRLGLRIGPIDPWVWLGLFVVYLIFDIVYGKYVLCFTKLDPWAGSTWSMVMCLITGLGTSEYISNLLNIIPIALGGGVGTFWVINSEKTKKRNKQKKFLFRMKV